MHPLETQVRQTWIDLKLPWAGVLVGVSAGPDSMALLHLLAALGVGIIPRLMAAYIDHGLRPGETRAEWECVVTAADRLGLACVRERIEVAPFAAARKMSLEHAARELRYRAFADLSRVHGVSLIAVAHTADDQVEEVLLRLLRGGGRKALSGMRSRSDNLIRPLLGVRKDALLAYLKQKQIPFCIDSSNDDPRFLRNRIRGQLLPLLEREYDPGIRRAILKTASNLAEDEDLLESLLATAWDEVIELHDAREDTPATGRLQREPFLDLHPALQRRLLERLLWLLGDDAGFAHILAVLEAARKGRTGGELHLSRGLRVRIGREHLEFAYPRGIGPWRGRTGDGGEGR